MARRRLTREARKEEILAAALQAFAKGGYHGTHVDAIVKAAGVARGTFYLHFSSKHDVFAALVDRTLQLFLDARPPAPDGELRTRADAERVIRHSYRTVFATFREHRVLGRVLFEEAVGIEKGFAAKVREHFASWHLRARALLDELAAHGVLRPGLDTDRTANLVLGMVEYVATRFLIQEAPVDVDAWIDAIVALELDGVTRRP